MEALAALADYKKRADTELQRYFELKTAEADGISELSGTLTRDLAGFTLRGGKRFRAALAYYGYKMFGGTDDREMLRLSLFMELIQSYLLIHDDIIDRSPLRRGGPTSHMVYERLAEQRGYPDGTHFGESMAIVVGDIAYQFALEMVAASNFPAERKAELIGLIAKEVGLVCFGQASDVYLGYRPLAEVSETDIMDVYRLKTATYTFKLPLFAGAILAGASAQDLEALEEYAIHCGIAYQIRDDVMGVFGDSEETGKDAKVDLSEGKKTLLITEALKNADQSQRQFIAVHLGKRDLSDQEAEEFRTLIKDLGALEKVTATCQEQAAQAKAALATLREPEAETYRILDGLADYMAVRTA